MPKKIKRHKIPCFECGKLMSTTEDNDIMTCKACKANAQEMVYRFKEVMGG